MSASSNVRRMQIQMTENDVRASWVGTPRLFLYSVIFGIPWFVTFSSAMQTGSPILTLMSMAFGLIVTFCVSAGTMGFFVKYSQNLDRDLLVGSALFGIISCISIVWILIPGMISDNPCIVELGLLLSGAFAMTAGEAFSDRRKLSKPQTIDPQAA